MSLNSSPLLENYLRWWDCTFFISYIFPGEGKYTRTTRILWDLQSQTFMSISAPGSLVHKIKYFADVSHIFCKIGIIYSSKVINKSINSQFLLINPISGGVQHNRLALGPLKWSPYFVTFLFQYNFSIMKSFLVSKNTTPHRHHESDP